MEVIERNIEIIFSYRNDYGVRSLQSILDMVKVFDFALSKGKVKKRFFGIGLIFISEIIEIV